MSVVHNDPMELKQQQRRRLRKRHLKALSRCFTFYRAYSILFNSSDVAEVFESWILKDCIRVQKKKKVAFSRLHVLHKKWNYAVTRRSRAMTATKEMYKKA